MKLEYPKSFAGYRFVWRESAAQNAQAELRHAQILTVLHARAVTSDLIAAVSREERNAIERAAKQASHYCDRQGYRHYGQPVEVSSRDACDPTYWCVIDAETRVSVGCVSEQSLRDLFATGKLTLNP